MVGSMRLRQLKAMTWWSVVRAKPAKKNLIKASLSYMISSFAVMITKPASKADSRQTRDG